MGHDHSEAAAEAMIAEGCIALKLDGKTELKKRVYGDWGRTAIAWAVWKSTSVSQKWIAERLGMKSAANVSQQVRRFDGLNDRELPKEIKRWKRNVRN